MNISSSDLANMFTSEEFLQTLRKAGNITYKTFNESGFLVEIDKDKTVFMSKVIEGTYFGLAGESDETLSNDIGILLAYIHFHPEANGPAVPSKEDLSLVELDRKQFVLNVDRLFNVKPLYGIGKVRRNKDIELLIYQEKHQSINSEIERASGMINNYLEEQGISPIEDSIVHSNIQTDEIVKVLNKGGYNACILNYPASLLSNREKRKHFHIDQINMFEKELEYFTQDITSIQTKHPFYFSDSDQCY